jgi:hypothetical protein
MDAEPQVFIYGRPDKRMGRQLGRHRIDCLNYVIKPVEDRLGSKVDHQGYRALTLLT